MSVTERIGGYLADRTSRRSFLARGTLAATALSAGPIDYLIRPGTAYAQICQCAGGPACDCSAPCCDGYTQFCCTINNGVNACPPGTFAGGWWKADGSIYCAGPRYYIDCMGECQGCGCAGGSFCPACDNLTCECALGNCNNRHVGCTEFRYGQCHTEIACSGRIACRVVSCTPPWVLDPTCSTVSQTDDTTANHFAPCQNGPTSVATVAVAIAAMPNGHGYWVVGNDGAIKAFGKALSYGSLAGHHLNKPVVGMAPTPTGKGYWLVAADGGIFEFGDAKFHGSTGNIQLNQPIVGMSADDVTGGYRFVAADGGVFTFHAPFFGSTGAVRLNKPIVGMAGTPTEKGYWLVASDGGIFEFGDARYHGSTGNVRLSQPIVAMARTATGKGYWLVGADGGIFEFGDARFHGSLGGVPISHPIVGMATTPKGDGYWLVASDGHVYHFGTATYWGIWRMSPSAALITAGIVLAIGAAIRSTWSPCGLSMLSTITPFGERSRGHRYAATALWFIAGSVAGGATLGALGAGLAGLARLTGVSTTRSAIAAAVIAAAGAAVDAGLFGPVTPIWRRQVDDGWLARYRPWFYGFGFGWQIGAGVATYIMTAAVFVLVAVAALTGSAVTALALATLFGFARGLAVLLTSRGGSPADLRALHRGLQRLEQPVRLAVVCMQAGMAALLVFASLGVVAAAATVVTAVMFTAARIARPAPIRPPRTLRQ